MSDQLDKPNVVIPLAISYDQRGMSTLATATDQRKVNAIYQVINNSQSGKRTLRVAKRPGITGEATTLAGVSGDVPHLIQEVGASDSWVFTKNSSNEIKAKNASTATIIDTDADRHPVYVDRTSINGTENIVLQTRHSSGDLSAAQEVWFSANDIAAWTRITDADFPNPIGKMEYMDGYAFALASTNRIHNSDLNSLSAWTAASYTTKNIQQDTPRGLAKHGQIILAFGGSTVEAFYNAGNTSGGVISRIPQLQADVGLALLASNSAPGWRHYAATLNKRLYFLGNGRGRVGKNVGLYMFDGAQYNRVSTDSVDAILFANLSLMSHVCSLSVMGRDAIAISFTSPGSSSQSAILYFPEWNEWFEWTSDKYQFVTDGNLFIGFATGSTTLATGVFNGDLYRDGDSTSYTMTLEFKIPNDGNQRRFMRWAGVKGDTSTSASTLNVEFSDDDYTTFSSARAIDMTQVTKKHIYRCGSFTDRVVRLTHATNVECRLDAFLARID